MMMSKLFRPAANLLSKGQPAKRLKELHEYLCLREALNPKETEAVLKDLEAVSKKHNITPNQATEIVYLLQNDPSHYKNYLRSSDLQHLESIFETEYSSSKLRDQNLDFKHYRTSIWSRYQDLAPFTKPGPERAAGLKTLENIFLKDGPTGERAYDSHAILNALPGIRHKISEHLKTLQGQSAQISPDHVASHKKSAPIAGRISKVLNDIADLIELHPTLTYGRIRGFVELSKGTTQETGKKAIGSGETALQSQQQGYDAHLNIYQAYQKEQEYDIPALIEERSAITQKTTRFQLANWVNDRLRIFEATLPKTNVALWNGIGILASLEFLYMLVQQESTITALLATGALGYYGLSCGSKLARQAIVDRLLSVDLHKDGKYVDLVIQGADGLKNVLDLPIESFKLHPHFKSIDAKGGNLKELAAAIGVTSTITVQDLQSSGLTHVGLFATYNDNYVFIPQVHQASNTYIENLFKGKTIAIADQTAKPTA